MGVGGQATSESATAGAAAAAFTCSSSAIRDCCGGPSNTRSHKSATLTYSKSAILGRVGNVAYPLRSTCDLLVQSQDPVIASSGQSPEQILWQFNCDVLQQHLHLHKRNNPDLVHRTPGCSIVAVGDGGDAGAVRSGDGVVSRTTTL